MVDTQAISYSAFDALPSIVLILDAKGGCIYSNKEAQNTFCLPFDAFLRNECKNSIHPYDAERVRQVLDIAIQSHSSFTISFRIITRTNKTRHLLAKSVYQAATNNSPACLVVTATEITKEDALQVLDFLNENELTNAKQAQAALEASEQKYKHVTETIEECILAYDEDFIITYANKKTHTLFNLREDQIVGKKMFDLPLSYIDEVDKKLFLSKQKLRYASNAKDRYELRVTTGNGHKWILVNVSVVSKNNKFAGAVVALVDITELKKQDELIKAQRDFYEAVLHQAPIEIAIYDADLRYVYCSKSSIKDDEMRAWIIGKTDIDYCVKKGKPLDDAHKRREICKRVMESGVGEEFIEELYDRNNNYKAYIRKAFPLRNPITNNIDHIAGFGIDLTNDKLREMEKMRMLDDITKRNRTLEQFTYVVSHNLRSPIANILALLEFYQQSVDENEKQEYVKYIKTSAENLDEMVKDLNELLSLSNSANAQKSLINLKEMVADFEKNISSQAHQISIQINADFSAWNEVYTVKSLFYSIFYNLISNSIKYHQPDKTAVIDIQSSVNNNQLVIRFADNGIGIDMKRHQSYVFGLYKRFHTSIEGKGMGLFMVKNHVENLGGDIQIESELNVGTVFTIRLPLE
jgi:PAS domain S-box-containing protein